MPFLKSYRRLFYTCLVYPCFKVEHFESEGEKIFCHLKHLTQGTVDILVFLCHIFHSFSASLLYLKDTASGGKALVLYITGPTEVTELGCRCSGLSLALQSGSLLGTIPKGICPSLSTDHGNHVQQLTTFLTR